MQPDSGANPREIERLTSDSTIPVGQIAERCKVSRTTIYKVAPRGGVLAGDSQPSTSGQKSHGQDVA
ncbi:helix-turn-helix domain-containing protein [Duganella vulcania]|uniref:helix-turn-helix domain-containing protein n=1 Tax=Duganella vulcania TaxID=2692166 RepID=UPI0020C583F7|nr:helix-turn-helix domain-containing protein [Duganella vulcania]